jgi:outer membrane protein assembly factor BamB
VGLAAAAACAVAYTASAGDVPYSVTHEVVWQTELEYAGKCSPRGADLNGDGLTDVVVGAGQEDQWGSVAALDGGTGELLWSRRMPDEVLVTAPLLDVNRDGAADVFIGGRKKLHDVYALSGRDGSTIWRLTEANPSASFPEVNFINLLLVEDRDGDGLRDLLVVQSGGVDAVRPAARFYWVRSADGTLLATRRAPDGKESYCIPLFEARDGGAHRVYFGTGGESLSGSLFGAEYAGLQERWRIRSLGGGFVGSPVLADLDGDGRDEILASAMNGAVYRIDADGGEIAWRWRDQPYWTYVTPAAGAFNAEPTLDVVTGFNHGIWPLRDRSRLVWLDGATGRLIGERTFGEKGRKTASSPLVLDADGDGRDETLIVLSNPVPDATVTDETHNLLLFDGGDARDVAFSLQLDGYSIATPRLADLDGDGKLDVVHASHHGVMRLELIVTGPDGAARVPRVAWGELRGPLGEGIYRRSR